MRQKLVEQVKQTSNPAIALTLAIFLEDAARVEMAALHAGAGGEPVLPLETAKGRAVWLGNVAERQWDYWTRNDCESIESVSEG